MLRIRVAQLSVILFLVVLTNGAKVTWPALEIQSENFFDPLMTSFSKFPFHDIYETPSDCPLFGQTSNHHQQQQRVPSSKSFREWTKQIQHTVDTSTEEGRSRLCEFLAMFPVGRGDDKPGGGGGGRRRFLPLKLRKLLKYCSANH